MRKSLEQRFWEKVDVRGSNDCWPWLACKDQGYGLIEEGGRRGKLRKATHVLFYLRHGYWPPRRRTANHHCDNPGCLNPHHLYLGTQKSNARDKYRRGRANHAKGEQHGMVTLIEKQVQKIRQLSACGVMQKEIGRRFSVSQVQVSRIVNNKSWKHI